MTDDSPGNTASSMISSPRGPTAVDGRGVLAGALGDGAHVRGRRSPSRPESPAWLPGPVASMLRSRGRPSCLGPRSCVMVPMLRCAGVYRKPRPVSKGDPMSEIDDLRAAVARIRGPGAASWRTTWPVTQLVAQYGPAVDSGSAEAAAGLWTEDGTFDAVGAMEMHGREQIAGMVRTQGHQDLIANGCGHVLTVPHVAVRRGRGRGSKLRPQHPLGPRARSASGWPDSPPTPGAGFAHRTAGASPSGSTPTSTARPSTGRCSRPGQA